MIASLKEVSKSYHNFKLDNINMDIPSGKIVGLIGENGAGKTTLISLMLNQIQRDSGTISIFGLDNIKDEIAIKDKLGFVVDECCFHACLTPKNVSTILANVYKCWDEKYYFKLLQQFEIQQNKKISEMSKGMKTKLMLMVAISHYPDFLILDEVTSGLDPVIRDDILRLLQEYIKGKNRSVFFSTHITSDLDKIADYVAFLHKGKLTFFESIETIQNRYYLVKESPESTVLINPNDIAITNVIDGETWLLLYDNSNSDYNKIGKRPTLDDIMLFHIKGESKN